MRPQSALTPSGDALQSQIQETPQRVSRPEAKHADPLDLLAELGCTARAAFDVVLDARPLSFREAG